MPLPPCRPPPRRSASLSPRRRPSIPEWNPVISGDGREEEEVRPVVLNDREYADGIGRIEDQGIRGGVPAKFLYRESAPAYWRAKEKSFYPSTSRLRVGIWQKVRNMNSWFFSSLGQENKDGMIKMH
ncbi:uncharacterized protein LOC103975151 [Musa acuminata AAA Group]|uniref:uncharacterized protein LOC103975151 n=1 Tax=Musa acuminata AAA Group TaxID=214697 RepID=UPI0031D62B8E